MWKIFVDFKIGFKNLGIIVRIVKIYCNYNNNKKSLIFVWVYGFFFLVL